MCNYKYTDVSDVYMSIVRGVLVESDHDSDIAAKSIKFGTDVRFDILIKKKYSLTKNILS